ncbi:MAG: long-chain fatty acid--CoA ligase [Desulfuromonadales bacterium]|uniref:AMP-dependent synthetase/ligase n=1 Tax=Desulfuromonas sp. KJ2020 TaxID=2919173 RepID=UPI0020A784CA|nr:AMP-binding protein [Desulfuromonas sp. KJ2020]
MDTVNTLLDYSCRKYFKNVALRQKVAGIWQETTHAQLLDFSNQVAAGLQKRGMKAGFHAALLAPSSPQWVCSYLGILKAGGVAVPVDKELKSSELKHILSDCEAKLIFTSQSYLDMLLDLKLDLPHLEQIILIDASADKFLPNREALAAVDALVQEWRTLSEEFNLPSDKKTALEALANRAHQALTSNRAEESKVSAKIDIFSPLSHIKQHLLKKGKLLTFDELLVDTVPEPSPRQADDIAVILYTSGTTGRSKGAMLCHGNIVSNILSLQTAFGLDSTIHTLSFLPINHVFEQVCGVLLPLSVGGKISFAESLKKLGENLAEVKPTFFLGVPAVYRLFYDRILKMVEGNPLSKTLFNLPLTRTMVASKVRARLGGDTIFVSGGAALDPTIAQGFKNLGIQIYQGYGITETSPVISLESPGKTRIGTVGRPLQGVEVKINQPNDEGVGEIVVRGPNVMKGYFKNTTATDEVLQEGWYATGDLGKIDAEGYLSICGRVKNLIVTPNGKNVYPEEVENELLQSPYIAEVMVYGHKVDANAEEVHASIFPDQEAVDNYAREKGISPMSTEQVEKLIREEVLEAGKRLADYKRVKKFTVREDEFPKTTTRKIKRFAVEAQIAATE